LTWGTRIQRVQRRREGKVRGVGHLGYPQRRGGERSKVKLRLRLRRLEMGRSDQKRSTVAMLSCRKREPGQREMAGQDIDPIVRAVRRRIGQKTSRSCQGDECNE
jgi:hypothetical protein